MPRLKLHPSLTIGQSCSSANLMAHCYLSHVTVKYRSPRSQASKKYKKLFILRKRGVLKNKKTKENKKSSENTGKAQQTKPSISLTHHPHNTFLPRHPKHNPRTTIHTVRFKNFRLYLSHFLSIFLSLRKLEEGNSIPFHPYNPQRQESERFDSIVFNFPFCHDGNYGNCNLYNTKTTPNL